MNPFHVSFVQDVKDCSQLAFAVNQNNFEIVVGRSGHYTLMRSRDKHDYEGGWIFLKQAKISFYSGALGAVSKNQDLIVDALITALSMRNVKYREWRTA